MLDVRTWAEEGKEFGVDLDWPTSWSHVTGSQAHCTGMRPGQKNALATTGRGCLLWYVDLQSGWELAESHRTTTSCCNPSERTATTCYLPLTAQASMHVQNQTVPSPIRAATPELQHVHVCQQGALPCRCAGAEAPHGAAPRSTLLRIVAP